MSEAMPSQLFCWMVRDYEAVEERALAVGLREIVSLVHADVLIAIPAPALKFHVERHVVGVVGVPGNVGLRDGLGMAVEFGKHCPVLAGLECSGIGDRGAEGKDAAEWMKMCPKDRACENFGGEFLGPGIFDFYPVQRPDPAKQPGYRRHPPYPSGDPKRYWTVNISLGDGRGPLGHVTGSTDR